MQQHAQFQAAMAYRKVAATVASPLRAIVLLLDGSILLLKKAIDAKKNQRLEEAHNFVVRTTTILRGLSLHLDHKKGGAFSEKMMRTYDALIFACLSSYGTPDFEARYLRLIDSLAALREAWSAVEQSSSQRAAGAPLVAVPAREFPKA